MKVLSFTKQNKIKNKKTNQKKKQNAINLASVLHCV